METQRQPKDSNWYNNRLVLILLFLAVYIFVPTLLTIWEKNNVAVNDIGIIGYFYLGAVLLGSLILLGVYLWGMRKTLKGEIGNAVNNIIKKEEIQATITEVARSVISKECISEAVKGATVTNDNKNVLCETVTDAIAKATVTTDVINTFLKNNPISKDEIIKTIKDAVETKMDVFLRTDEAKGVFKGEIKDSTTQDLIKGAIKDAVLEMENSIEQARHDESEEKKYRFTERVVEEICKSNKSGSIDICNLRALIGSILNDDKGCSVNIIEEGDNAKIVVIEKDCKQNVLVFDNAQKVFTSDGNFTLCNGAVITINGGKNERIKKP